MTSATIVLLIAVFLDLLLGDPVYRLHPVRMIGGLSATLERGLRRLGLAGVGGGVLLMGAVLMAVLGTYLAVRYAAGRLYAGLGVALDIYVVYSCIALRDMVAHARPVASALKQGDSEAARRLLRQIVGRDVTALNEEGMARATVESVAESFVDGFLAPLFWFLVAAIGAGLAGAQPPAFATAAIVAYRCVNTLDSMVGYRNDRYRLFGRAAARTDDALNFFPARLSPALLWFGASVLGLNARDGWRTALRDRLKHASPNSAHAESFVAGALGLRLGGPTVYPHGTVDRPWLGAGSEITQPQHIGLVCRLTLTTGLVSTALAVLALEVIL